MRSAIVAAAGGDILRRLRRVSFRAAVPGALLLFLALGQGASAAGPNHYRLVPVDGRRAFCVHGSDVYGPMGRELVPFEREEDARVFLADHKGKGVLPFRDITPALLKELE